MKPSYVIDTNVFVTASGLNDAASQECVKACQDFLINAYSTGNKICIDDGNLILNEYSRHLNYSGNPSIADEYFKFIHENQGVADNCERVSINSRHHHELIFEEIPDDINLYGFDKSDQKFLAVGLVSVNNPIIVNATDSDWIDFREYIEPLGINLMLLCN